MLRSEGEGMGSDGEVNLPFPFFPTHWADANDDEPVDEAEEGVLVGEEDKKGLSISLICSAAVPMGEMVSRLPSPGEWNTEGDDRARLDAFLDTSEPTSLSDPPLLPPLLLILVLRPVRVPDEGRCFCGAASRPSPGGGGMVEPDLRG